MKQLFEGEVYEILPLRGGIIFSYCKGTCNDNVLVAYRMLSFDNGKFSNVENDIYLITKFGNNYKAIASLFENHIKVKSIVLPSGKVFVMEPDGSTKLLDTNAEAIWTGSLLYKGAVPSDIALYNNTLLATYPDCNAILSYNISTMKEELRIGGNKSPFKKPKSLSVNGDCVAVCNLESQNILEVNMSTYKLKELENFEEPVYQYLEVAGNRFVLLQSGLYLLDWI